MPTATRCAWCYVPPSTCTFATSSRTFRAPTRAPHPTRPSFALRHAPEAFCTPATPKQVRLRAWLHPRIWFAFSIPFSSFVFADPVSVCAYNTNGPPPLPVSKGSGPLNVLYVSLLYIAQCLGRWSFRCIYCKLVVRLCLRNVGFRRL